ncbi:protein DEEPER ROOTING 1-like [Salvia hispanica]|uniref:protein DEEPER ROOTING 1-like n=1 Tax=Salvia hispanica TaxID=49212 RepID=UPI0020096B73|nr:protein DEEPER ROOTING 1-like [Salvia hispanica]
MKFCNWMQSKFNGDKRPNSVPITNQKKKEPPKEEFSDWPHGLLTIWTFGNTARTDSKEEIQAAEEQCSSPDLSEFTVEEVWKLQKELKKLLTRKSSAEEQPAD